MYTVAFKSIALCQKKLNRTGLTTFWELLMFITIPTLLDYNVNDPWTRKRMLPAGGLVQWRAQHRFNTATMIMCIHVWKQLGHYQSRLVGKVLNKRFLMWVLSVHLIDYSIDLCQVNFFLCENNEAHVSSFCQE